jgi:anthranilate/para-aminobenzoate synthase component II
MTEKATKVLFIDNFDSFTYNLVDEFAKRQCPTKVYRADTPLAELVRAAEAFGPECCIVDGAGNRRRRV